MLPSGNVKGHIYLDSGIAPCVSSGREKPLHRVMLPSLVMCSVWGAMNSSRQHPVVEPSAEGGALLREHDGRSRCSYSLSNNSAGDKLNAFRDIAVGAATPRVCAGRGEFLARFSRVLS